MYIFTIEFSITGALFRVAKTCSASSRTILFAIVAVVTSFAQAPDVLTHEHSANRWMTLPDAFSVGPADVLPAVRQVRDSYFDGLIGERSLLTPETASSKHYALGGVIGVPADLPLIPDRQVVVGTFSSHRTILSGSRRSIYTEISFTLEEVFEVSQGSPANPKKLTVIVPGGTAINDKGQIISFLTDPRLEFVQPARRYLLVVSHQKEGDFDMIARAWELTGGMLQPSFNASRTSFAGQSWERILVTLHAKFGGK